MRTIFFSLRQCFHSFTVNAHIVRASNRKRLCSKYWTSDNKANGWPPSNRNPFQYGWLISRALPLPSTLMLLVFAMVFDFPLTIIKITIKNIIIIFIWIVLHISCCLRIQVECQMLKSARYGKQMMIRTRRMNVEMRQTDFQWTCHWWNVIRRAR